MYTVQHIQSHFTVYYLLCAHFALHFQQEQDITGKWTTVTAACQIFSDIYQLTHAGCDKRRRHTIANGCRPYSYGETMNM